MLSTFHCFVLLFKSCIIIIFYNKTTECRLIIISICILGIKILNFKSLTLWTSRPKLIPKFSIMRNLSIQWKFIIVLCFYGLLRYLSSIAILITTRDRTHAPCASPETHPVIDPNQTTFQTTNQLIAQPLSGIPNCAL